MTPDPVSFFFGKRRLGIDIRDDYGRLLDGSADPGAIHQGGDQANEAPIGGQPLAVTSTRTVALFSGPMQVRRDGKAFVDLDIPDFEGHVRLMVVAYDRHATGNPGSGLGHRNDLKQVRTAGRCGEHPRNRVCSRTIPTPPLRGPGA
jgi:alpha-2-macroglobulin